MATTNITPTIADGVIGPLDTAPDPVPPGPGSGVPIPVPATTGLARPPATSSGLGNLFAPLPTQNVVVAALPRTVTIQYDSNTLTTSANTLNFTGPGVYLNNLGNGNILIQVAGGNGAGIAAGGNTQIQFNQNGTFGASGNLTYNANTNILATTGNVDAAYFVGSGSRLSGITGSNVVGLVANAQYSNLSGTATSATTANVAYSVSGANVSGTVANATYATSAGAATIANYANSAGAVAGANVSGTVNQAAIANVAYVAWSVAGANVSGAVANAGYATNAEQAGLATLAATATTAVRAQTVTTAAQPNITSVGTLTSLVSTGNITTTGYLFGNGSQLTGLPATYSNANVQAYLPTYTGNLTPNNLSTTGNANVGGFVSTVGNVLAGNNLNATNSVVAIGGNIRTISGYFIGNGSFLTGVQSSYGDSNVALFLPTYTGNINGQAISLTGNITTPGNISTTGNVISTKNVYGANFIGGGAQLSNITGANVLGIVNNAYFANAAGSANSATIATVAITAGTVTTAAQPNITSVGTLSTLAVTGNISGGNISGNGSALTSITGANVLGTVANAGYAANSGNALTAQNSSFATSAATANTVTNPAQSAITSVGTLTSLAVSGAVSGGNTTITGAVTASGNISTSGYVLGNGALLTGIAASYGNSNVATYLPTYTGNLPLLTGNVTTTANVQGAFVKATAGAGITGNILVSGNTVSSYYFGNGSQLTGIVATNANAQLLVGNTLSANVINTSITSVGTLGNLTVSGRITTSSITSGDSSFVTIEDGIRAEGGVETPILVTNTITSDNSAFVTVVDGLNVENNIESLGTISAVGNVEAGGFFVGNGSQLTGVTAAAANIFNTVSANGTSLVASSPNDTVTLTPGTNVTIVGNATSKTATVGIETAPTFAGNVTGGNIITGGVVSSTGNVTGAYFLGNVANAVGAEQSHNHPGVINGTSIIVMPLINGNATVTIGGTSNVMVVANTGAYVSGLVSATGNVSGGNITSPGVISATGNMVAANVSTGGIVSATGNIAGNFFIGNGSLLTGIAAGGYGNSNVVTLLAGYGSNTISTTGNISSNYFIGNGSLLTGIANGVSSYGNANVAANLAAFGSNPISTTGNVTANNFIGNVVGGGAGTPTISSTTNLDLSAVSAVRVIGGGTFRLPSLTTAQIANTIAANGDMIYNSSVNKFQGYEGGAWANII